MYLKFPKYKWTCLRNSHSIAHKWKSETVEIKADFYPSVPTRVIFINSCYPAQSDTNKLMLVFKTLPKVSCVWKLVGSWGPCASQWNHVNEFRGSKCCKEMGLGEGGSLGVRPGKLRFCPCSDCMSLVPVCHRTSSCSSPGSSITSLLSWSLMNMEWTP